MKKQDEMYPDFESKNRVRSREKPKIYGLDGNSSSGINGNRRMSEGLMTLKVRRAGESTDRILKVRPSSRDVNIDAL